MTAVAAPAAGVGVGGCRGFFAALRWESASASASALEPAVAIAASALLATAPRVVLPLLFLLRRVPTDVSGGGGGGMDDFLVEVSPAADPVGGSEASDGSGDCRGGVLHCSRAVSTVSRTIA